MAPPRSYDGVGLPGAARGMDVVFSSGPRQVLRLVAGRGLATTSSRVGGPALAPSPDGPSGPLIPQWPPPRRAPTLKSPSSRASGAAVRGSAVWGSTVQAAGVLAIGSGSGRCATWLAQKGPCCPGSGRGPTLGPVERRGGAEGHRLRHEGQEGHERIEGHSPGA